MKILWIRRKRLTEPRASWTSKGMAKSSKYKLAYVKDGQTTWPNPDKETLEGYLELFNYYAINYPHLNVSFFINNTAVVSRMYPELAHWMSTGSHEIRTIVHPEQKEAEFYRQISELEV